MKFTESKLDFLFGKKWSNLIQLDEHIDYKKIPINNTKSVDFLGIYNANNLIFIEVKNFTNHRIENQSRLINNAEYLVTEVAQKIRDSISCIVGGRRNSTNDKQMWKSVSSCLLNKNIIIILWLEENNNLQKQTFRIADYQKKLQSKLKWLTGKSSAIRIYNRTSFSNNLDFMVTNLEKI